MKDKQPTDPELRYIMGGCTCPYCSLCAALRYSVPEHLRGRHHAGIASYPHPQDSIASK